MFDYGLAVSTFLAGLAAGGTAWILARFKDEKQEKLAQWMQGDHSTQWIDWYFAAFDSLFGEKHLTWKCFSRSVTLSLLSVAVISLLMIVLNPILPQRAETRIPVWEFLLVAIVVNAFFADYLSLLETRYVLKALRETKSLTLKLLIVLVDIGLSILIISAAIYGYLLLRHGEVIEYSLFVGAFSYYSVFFYSTFITSIWAWFFFLASVLVRFTSSSVVSEYMNYQRYASSIFGAAVGLVAFVAIYAVVGTSKPGEDGRSVLNRGLCLIWQDTSCRLSADLAQNPEGVFRTLNRKCFVNKTCSRSELRVVEQACKDGAAGACVRLGVLYHNGENIAVDMIKAKDLFDRACALGDWNGCNWLGDAYYHGRGADLDYAKATLNYRLACEQGFLPGCRDLGLMYRDGKSVGEDSNKAAELFLEACEGEHALACFDLGVLYETGQLSDPDLEQAIAFYSRACNGGNRVGCHNLGVNLLKEAGGFFDAEAGLEALKQACEASHAESCLRLAFEFIGGVHIDRDLQRSVSLFEKACDLGNMEGCDQLSRAYAQGQGVAQDVSRAFELADRACKADDPEACWYVGRSYAIGNVVTRRFDLAKTYFQRSCDAGVARGCGDLGVLYLNGYGVLRDRERARALFRTACDGNEEEEYCDRVDQLRNPNAIPWPKLFE